jgi:GDP/UDP-N,N'-diacetylbacillosamine 2-epimerase (hydrolysing)
MKLLFVLGSRGEWGYFRPLIRLAQESGHEVEIWCANMSVLSRFGKLSEVITNEGYPVVGEFYTALEGDDNIALAKSFGLVTLSASDWLMNNKYDWVIVSGDRVEQLAFVIVASLSNLAICHIQAGERSGNIDGKNRHAIARYAHVHIAANEDAAERLIRSGEDADRVKITGAPQLDDLWTQTLPSLHELMERTVVKSERFILSVFHGVTEDLKGSKLGIGVLVKVLSQLDLPVIWIGSNNDTLGVQIEKQIISNLKVNDRFYSNLNRLDYLALLSNCEFIIGNSSSGILEAPTFGKPAINLGPRQVDRYRGVNVIDCEYDQESILDAIKTALSDKFRAECKGSENPYGRGDSSARILKILETTPITSKFLMKQIVY